MNAHLLNARLWMKVLAGILISLCMSAGGADPAGATNAADAAGPAGATSTAEAVDPAGATGTEARPEAVRTLEAITIHGEIAVPQVLFITSRDHPRYRDGLRSRFRLSTLEVARSLDLPTRLRVVARPVESKEERP